MRVLERTEPLDHSCPPGQDIQREVTAALQSVKTQGAVFVVNDSPWYWKNPQGALKPCAVNSAKFISKKFQGALGEHGWTIEPKIAGQKFDGYKEFSMPDRAFSIPEELFLAFLNAHYDIHEKEQELDREISSFYQRLVKRTIITLDDIEDSLRSFFKRVEVTTPMRVGLEFETGNIASSFRALIKLNNLYADGHIDLGVFVTSIDKASCATRIWPATNRNGSFEELDARDFRSNLIVPLWEFGFAPDRFSSDVSYLGQGGLLYDMQHTGRSAEHSGTEYEIWIGDRGREVLRLGAA